MFKIGDKIVYPNHGAGTIDSIEKRNFWVKKRLLYPKNANWFYGYFYSTIKY